MWKVVDVNGQIGFLKYERQEAYHKVYFSNVEDVWMENLTCAGLSERCKEMNSLVEAEPEDLAEHLYKLIVDGQTGMIITHFENQEEMKLHIKSELADVPFFFMFKMEKMNATVVCKEITVPLMLLALKQQDLLAQLQGILLAKDAEIEQYKLEGAILKKKKIETLPFCESIHQNSKYSLQGDIKAVELFRKICSLLKEFPTTSENSALRNLEVIDTKIEVKTRPDVKTEFSTSAHDTLSMKVEYSGANMKQPAKQKLASRKKPKLRI